MAEGDRKSPFAKGFAGQVGETITVESPRGIVVVGLGGFTGASTSSDPRMV